MSGTEIDLASTHAQAFAGHQRETASSCVTPRLGAVCEIDCVQDASPMEPQGTGDA